MRNSVAVFLSAALLGCVAETPKPSDTVRDEASAIRLGKVCAAAAYLDGDWHAELRSGVWKVWFNWRGENFGPTYQTTVKASDGTVGQCETRVEAD